MQQTGFSFEALRSQRGLNLKQAGTFSTTFFACIKQIAHPRILHD